MEKLLPASDRYSAMLNVPFMVTSAPLRAVKELAYNMVHTWMSQGCFYSLEEHNIISLLNSVEFDSVHITLIVKDKHSVINIQIVYYILSLCDSATLSFSRQTHIKT